LPGGRRLPYDEGMTYRLHPTFCLILSAALVSAPALGAKPRSGASAELAILETSDLHSAVVGYDYFKLAEDPSLGLDRTAQARRDFPNTLLFDNGDTIQGNALGDYQATVDPLKCGKLLGIYKAMKKIGYDGIGIGNHDFNFGLAYLGQVTGQRLDVEGVPAKQCAGPGFPVVLANVYSTKTKKPLFAPYRILTRRIQAVDVNGKPFEASVKVGIIGFTPPAILNWDRHWLEGKIYTEGLVETAKRYLPEMRAKGADVVVAISHGGLDASPYSPAMENGNYYLAQMSSQIGGIDALLLGHSHQAFPNPSSTVAQFNLPNVDKVKGRVFGVPTVMANLWGKNLGVVRLQLRYDGKRWHAEQDAAIVENRTSQQPDKTYVAADPSVMDLVKIEHEATIRYVKTPIGSADFRMSTYFAVSAIQIVNQAQADYARKYVQANLPQYAKLPVLSVSAPFKSGSAGVADYTDVAAGDLALNNAADLYLYPNALALVKVDGAGLKAWLEKAASRFNTIDASRTEPQELVNTGFAGYNFDTVTSPEVTYEIDVTRAPGRRIVNLQLHGEPLADGQEFLVATNNYRASGGGNFPGLDGSRTVLAAPDASRDVLIAYVKEAKRLSRAANGAQRSWRFAKVATRGPVVFHSAPGKLELARAAGLENVSQLAADDGQGKGFALYAVDLAK
jgi:2',3'-cyclic-nucleotide 2'-phosphodiesterase/3'-nucleotidase